jgi:hypothetical protein
MASTSNFPIIVGTVDRVLASQIKRVFDDTIVNDLRPQDIGAAPLGAGSTALIFPQYKTSDMIGVFCPGSTGGNTGPATKERRFSLIYIPASGSLNKFIFRTGTNAPNNVNIQLALWSVDSDGKPADFLGEALTTTGSAATTTYEVTLASQIEVAPGFYYMSFTPAAAVTGGSILALNPTVDGIYGSIFGKVDLSGNPVILKYTAATSYDQKNHETFTTAAVSMVNMGVRYA